MGLESLAVDTSCRTLLAMIKNMGYIKVAKGSCQMVFHRNNNIIQILF